MKQFLFFILFLAVVTANAQTRVACVGNSITYGAGIDGRDSLSYPAQLQKMLGKTWEVKNFGVSGATLLRKGNKPYWKENAFADALAFQPEIVIIKLGTNDSKAPNWQYKKDFVADYEMMISIFRSLKSVKKIYICLPIPAFAMKWEINPVVVRDEVLPMVQLVGKNANVDVIDLFYDFLDKESMVPDKIHPDAQGAKIMAEKIYPMLKTYREIYK
jgi:acyl-CoA thioesterase I